MSRIGNRARIAASERRIVAAEAALSFAQERQRNGTGLALEVLDARVELTDARRSRLEAITDYDKAQVSLMVLTGSSPAGAGSVDR